MMEAMTEVLTKAVKVLSDGGTYVRDDPFQTSPSYLPLSSHSSPTTPLLPVENYLFVSDLPWRANGRQKYLPALRMTLACKFQPPRSSFA